MRDVRLPLRFLDFAPLVLLPGAGSAHRLRRLATWAETAPP